MDVKTYLRFLALVICVGFPIAGKAAVQNQDDISDVPCKEFVAGGDINKRYFLIGGGEKIEPPEDGFKLVVVLPGGDGGPGFNPFIRRIYKYSLNPKYLMAQLIAVRWTPDQQIVWPTKRVTVQGQKFSTEEFVEAVIKDIKAKYKLNPKQIFTLAWSSGGPAAYAISLQKEKSVVGTYIAMSAFDANTLGPLDEAAGHCYFFAHSPDDKVCPMKMAQKANEMLTEAGATTRFVSYKGGHGWYGNCYGRLEWGFGWLEKAVLDQARSDQTRRLPLPVVEGFETGVAAPDGWQEGRQLPGVEYIWDKNNAFKGSASLCIKKTIKRPFPIAQWCRDFDYDGKSKKVYVSAQVKAEKVTKATIDVQFYTAARKPLGHQLAAYIGAKDANDLPADHDWKQYSGTVPIADGTKIIVIALQNYGSGTIWFDELTADYVKPENQN